MTSSLSTIKVFATHPHPCSYLDDQQATTLFVDPDTIINQTIYSELADVGFRRSGQHIYRPQCESCQACIAARIPVEHFHRKRSHRKIWNRNQDLQIEAVTDISAIEYYQLYEKYISVRHSDGDMYPPNREQFDSFLTDEMDITRYYTFKSGERLLAVVVIDLMERGLSAIYTYFDPDMERRSLGTFAILWQVELARKLGLPYLYLGYWIKECRKMSYKIEYRPVELLINGSWLTLN